MVLVGIPGCGRADAAGANIAMATIVITHATTNRLKRTLAILLTPISNIIRSRKSSIDTTTIREVYAHCNPIGIFFRENRTIPGRRKVEEEKPLTFTDGHGRENGASEKLKG